jgi:hypothetical protein
MSKHPVSAAGGAMSPPRVGDRVAKRAISPASTRLNRSAIMTRAWQIARAWHADARSFHYAQQQSCPRVALRLEAPAPFVRKLRAHFAEALRQAWAEARKVDAPPETAEIIAARREVIAARMIDSTRIALPAIAAAEARLAILQNSALRS